jgi:hypothetical protein
LASNSSNINKGLHDWPKDTGLADLKESRYIIQTRNIFVFLAYFSKFFVERCTDAWILKYNLQYMHMAQQQVEYGRAQDERAIRWMWHASKIR